MNHQESSSGERRNESLPGRRRSDHAPLELKKDKRSKLGRIAIGVSFLFSIVTIVYAFSIPFRDAKRNQRSNKAKSGVEANLVRLDPITQSLLKREVSHQRRKQAFADHEVFLGELRDSKATKRKLPGYYQAKKSHEVQSIKLQAEIRQLQDLLENKKIPEDDAIREYMANMNKVIQDAPR